MASRINLHGADGTRINVLASRLGLTSEQVDNLLKSTSIDRGLFVRDALVDLSRALHNTPVQGRC